MLTIPGPHAIIAWQGASAPTAGRSAASRCRPRCARLLTASSTSPACSSSTATAPAACLVWRCTAAAHPLIKLVWDWTGLDWIGLCCTGLDYTGLKLTLLDLTRCIAARPSSIRVVLSWPMSRPTARSRADLQHQGLSCAPSCAPISATSPGSSCSERASWCALARARATPRSRLQAAQTRQGGVGVVLIRIGRQPWGVASVVCLGFPPCWPPVVFRVVGRPQRLAWAIGLTV